MANCYTRSGIDGTLVNYSVEYGNRGVKPSVEEDFMSNAEGGDEFYNAEGENSLVSTGNVEDFFDADGSESDMDFDEFMPDSYLDDLDDNYSNFTVWSKKKRRRFGKKLKKFGQDVGKVAKGVISTAMANKSGLTATPTPPPPPPPPPVKKGLSVGAQVGIAVGAVAVIGIAAYFLTKKK